MTTNDEDAYTRCVDQRNAERETTRRPEGHHPDVRAGERNELAIFAKALESIVNGFRAEALNGVICTPTDDELGGPQWDAEPHRTWCARCKARWARLFALADKMKASVRRSGEADGSAQ